MNEDVKLNRLLTYTTFHIGVYISLVTAIIGAGIYGAGVEEALLRYCAACILLAGFFGGTIGSNIPDADSYEDLGKDKLKVVFNIISVAKLERCINLEHFFFWMGVLPPALMFITNGSLEFGD